MCWGNNLFPYTKDYNYSIYGASFRVRVYIVCWYFLVRTYVPIIRTRSNGEATQEQRTNVSSSGTNYELALAPRATRYASVVRFGRLFPNALLCANLRDKKDALFFKVEHCHRALCFGQQARLLKAVRDHLLAIKHCAQGWTSLPCRSLSRTKGHAPRLGCVCAPATFSCR